MFLIRNQAKSKLTLSLFCCLAVLFAFAVTPLANAIEYVPEEVNIKFINGTASETRNRIEKLPGVSSSETTGPQERLLKLKNGEDVQAVIAELKKSEGIEYAVPNVKAHASFIPNDPGKDSVSGWQQLQWNFLAGAGINAPQAWDNLIRVGPNKQGGRGVKIAVLDTGIAYRNFKQFIRSPDLRPSNFIAGFDFVDHSPFALDRNGHGTHVASTIAEWTNNDIGLTGIAYGAKIMPVRVLNKAGEGDAATIAKGIRFAVSHGVDIINMSLEFGIKVESSQIPMVLSAIRFAHSKGVLMVAASGNEAANVISFPARARHVIGVGATTEHLCLSEFSNEGHGLDMVAPGGGADAPDSSNDPGCQFSENSGRDIFQITMLGGNPRKFGIPTGYEGTSMAVPHVTATAALIIASGRLGPHPTPNAVEARLKATAHHLGTPAGPNLRYGAGLIDAAAATDPNV